MAEAITTDVVARISADSSRFVTGMQEASRSAEDFTGRVGFASQSISRLGVVAGAMGVGMIGFARNAFSAAARVEELDVAMQAVGRSTGIGYQVLEDTAKAIKKNGIEYASAQNMALLYAKAQLNLADSVKISRVAQDLAVISQENSTDTAMRLTYAIMNQDTVMLRNLGITKSAGEAFAEYARANGVSTKALTEHQKKQAITQMIMEEGKKVAGTYEAAMTSAGKVLRSFPRLFNDMSVSIGRALTTSFGPLILNVYNVTKAFAKLFEEGGALTPYIDAIGMAFTAILKPMTEAFKSLETFFKKIQSNYEIAERYKDFLGTSGEKAQLLAEKIKFLLPFFAALATFMAINAGAGLLSALPVIGGLLGGLVPLLGAFTALVLLVPELQTKMMALGSALAPLLPVIANIATTIGTIFMVALNQLMGPLDLVIDRISLLTGWILKNQDLVTQLAMVIAGVATAFSVLTTAVNIASKAMQVYGTIQKVVSATNPIVLAIGAIVIAIGLMVAAFIYAWHNVEGFAKGFKDAFNYIANSVGEGVQKVLKTLAGLARRLSGFFSSLPFNKGAGIAEKLNSAANSMENLGNQVSKVTSGDTFGKLSSSIGKAMDSAKTKVEGLVEKLKGLSGEGTGQGNTGINDGADPDGSKGNRAISKKARKAQERAKLIADTSKRMLDYYKAQAQDVLNYANNIASSMVDFASIASLGAGENVPISTEMITTNLQQRLDAINKWKNNIQKLVDLGLGQQTLADVIQMGPIQGNRFAEALIAGGKEAINLVNSLQGQINEAAVGVGTVAGNAYGMANYGFGVTTAAGIASGTTTITTNNNIVINGAVDEVTAKKIKDEIAKAIAEALKSAGLNAKRK